MEQLAEREVIFSKAWENHIKTVVAKGLFEKEKINWKKEEVFYNGKLNKWKGLYTVSIQKGCVDN